MKPAIFLRKTRSGSTRTVRAGPPLADRRVAIISTAGLHPPGEQTFDLRDTGYRVIPDSYNADELVMSHASVNFDRTGFQQDTNVVFPIDRLQANSKPTAKSARLPISIIPSWAPVGNLPRNRGHLQTVGRSPRGRPGQRRATGPRLTELHARRGRDWHIIWKRSAFRRRVSASSGKTRHIYARRGPMGSVRSRTTIRRPQCSRASN